MEIKIKDLDVLNLHPKLTPIVKEVMKEFRLEVITSAYRPGDKGVHGQMPVRGLDLRCREPIMGTSIEHCINFRWEYDPDRPTMLVCISHDTGKGFHVHLQVHRNTVRR